MQSAEDASEKREKSPNIDADAKRWKSRTKDAGEKRREAQPKTPVKSVGNA